MITVISLITRVHCISLVSTSLSKPPLLLDTRSINPHTIKYHTSVLQNLIRDHDHKPDGILRESKIIVTLTHKSSNKSTKAENGWLLVTDKLHVTVHTGLQKFVSSLSPSSDYTPLQVFMIRHTCLYER